MPISLDMSREKYKVGASTSLYTRLSGKSPCSRISSDYYITRRLDMDAMLNREKGVNKASLSYLYRYTQMPVPMIAYESFESTRTMKIQKLSPSSKFNP